MTLSSPIKELIGKQEIQRSLKTTNPVIAGFLAHELKECSQQYFLVFMKLFLENLTQSEKQALVNHWFNEKVSTLQAQIAMHGLRGDNTWDYELDPYICSYKVDKLDADINKISHRLKTGNYNVDDDELTASLLNTPIASVDTNSDEFITLRSTIVKALSDYKLISKEFSL